MEIEQNGNNFYIDGHLVMLVSFSKQLKWHIVEANDKVIVSFISTEAKARIIAMERCEKLRIKAEQYVANANPNY